MNNVNALDHKMIVPRLSNVNYHLLTEKPGKDFLKTTMPAPEKALSIPKNAWWLSGEGVGSWFATEFVENQLMVTRYSPEGVIECTGYFKNPDLILPEYNYKISYPSNCKEITILSGNRKIRFERVEDISELAQVV